MSVNGDRTVTTAGGGARDRSTTYRELGEQVARLAHALRGVGITGDQRVGTFMWNNVEHLAVHLAAPSMGAVLHTLDVRLSPKQIAHIANEAEDQVVVADLSLASRLAPVLPMLTTVHTILAVGDGDLSPLQNAGMMVIRYDDALGGRSPEYEWPDIDEKNAAALCHSSSAAGDPKGVVYSHRSTFLHSMSACTANVLGIGVADSVLPIVPMFHANAWGLPYAALMAGADLVLPDRFTDAPSLLHLIATRRPTVAGAVPAIWNSVLNRLERHPGQDISSLRLVACGGSAVPRSMKEVFEQRYGVRIQQTWGSFGD